MERTQYKPPMFIDYHRQSDGNQPDSTQQPLMNRKGHSYDPESSVQNNAKNKSCSLTKTLCKIGGFLVTGAALFTAGYLVSHFVEIPIIDNWLNSFQDQNKNLTDRQVFTSTPGNYANTTLISDDMSSLITNGTTTIYNMVTKK